MKDYVNLTMKTPAQLWLTRNAEAVKFAAFVLAMAIIGSIGV